MATEFFPPESYELVSGSVVDEMAVAEAQKPDEEDPLRVVIPEGLRHRISLIPSICEVNPTQQPEA
jgi:hypothetical protein